MTGMTYHYLSLCMIIVKKNQFGCLIVTYC